MIYDDLQTMKDLYRKEETDDVAFQLSEDNFADM